MPVPTPFRIDEALWPELSSRMKKVLFTGCSAPVTVVASCLLMFTVAARADVRLPAVFSDNMVLQQGVPVTVWGFADEGEEVTVQFQGQSVKATAFKQLPNPASRWKLRLAPLKASATPDVFTVSGKNKLERKNVLVGEVWIASGQSNMEFGLRSSHESQPDMDAANLPLIRLFTVPRAKLTAPADDVKASWQVCSPQSVQNFSAVAFYFGRDLHAALKVPIGLIHTSWGGTPAEAWTSQSSIEGNAELRRDFVEKFANAQNIYADAVKKYYAEAEELKKKGQKPAAPAPKAPAPPPTWRGAELYNGMIAPLVPYAIKGAIWYQGEANASRFGQYRVLFPEMIKGWRKAWEQGDFPFLAVQLAPWDKSRKRSLEEITAAAEESDWARLREVQVQTAQALPNYGLAVITDVGDKDDIHPTKKRPVGARLALAARAIAYGEKISYAGPAFKAMNVQGEKAVLSFEHVGAGLEARGGKLTGFAVCGADKKFVPADAELRADQTIAVSAPTVKQPVAVRFGWADFPVVNLFNKDGLPASPFRTDTFPPLPPPAPPGKPAPAKK